MIRNRLFAVTMLAGLACGGLTISPARAQSLSYHVSLDTSSLAASMSTPFSLDFQFTDGGTPGNNTVTLTHFTFGAGSAAPAPSSLLGGATGNANSTITLADSGFINELVQGFTPGQTLAFDLSLTANLNTAPGSSPDEFSFALLDSSGNEIGTTAANNAFVTIDVDSSNPTVTPAGTPPGATFAIPVPQVQATAVPEPGSLALFVSISGALVVGVRLRRGVTQRS